MMNGDKLRPPNMNVVSNERFAARKTSYGGRIPAKNVLYLFSLTLVAMASSLPMLRCDLDPGVRTRHSSSTLSSCFGVISNYLEKEARQRGFLREVSLCYGHAKERLTAYNRCGLLFDRDRCSGPLRDCPERLWRALDDLAGAVVGYLCRRHAEEIDSKADVIESSFYTPPAKRSAAILPVRRPELTLNDGRTA